MNRELTLLGNDCHHGILVDIFHRLHTAIVHRCDHVDTPDPPLAIGRCVQQGGLEVCVQLRIQLAIVAEDHSHAFVCIDAANLQIGTEGVLDEVAVV